MDIDDEDELVADKTPQSSPGGVDGDDDGDEDDEDEYEQPVDEQPVDDEDDEIVDADDGGEIDIESGGPPGEDEDKRAQVNDDPVNDDPDTDDDDGEPDDKKAYIMFNRGAYYVPPWNGLLRTAGRIRDHYTCIEVADATILGQMNNSKNWPKASDLSPLSIVVVKGLHDSAHPMSTNKNTGPFHWYARVVIKGNCNQKCHDSQILRPIPKAVVIEYIHHMAKIDYMKSSSLVTKFQPEHENAKPFPVQPNGWKKVIGIKTEAIPLTRTPKRPQLAEEDQHVDSLAVEEEQEHLVHSVEKQAVPKKPVNAANSASAQKRPMSSLSPAPDAKKVKDSAIVGSKKATAGSSRVFIKKNTPVPPSSMKCPVVTEPKRDQHAQKKMVQSTPKSKHMSISVDPVEKLSTHDSGGDGLINGLFKKVQRVECVSRETTTVFWVGNAVFVCQA